jgi:hypothetical protein
MGFKKHLVGHRTPRQTLRSACTVKWSVLHNQTHRQNKHINLKRIKGHNSYPLNKLADRKSNNASTAMQLRIADHNIISPLVVNQIKTIFLYQHGKITNEDFGKFLRNLVQVKNSITTEKIIADHHGCVPKLKSTSHALAPTTLLNIITGLRFRLRLAA